ncbi:MAG: alpha/beta hydrolase [Spirosomataceae bacterium]
MKNLLVYALCFFVSLGSTPIWAQSTAGVIFEKDTSFSSYSAFKQIAKKYPESTRVLPSYSDKRTEKTPESPGGVIYRLIRKETSTTSAQPVLLIVHGGGWRSGSPEQHLPLAQQLAEHGMTCLLVQYRLSTHALYPAAVHDVRKALQWVYENALIEKLDTTQIALLGFSAGAQLATLVGTLAQEPSFAQVHQTKTYPVQALINIDGILAFIHPESGEGIDLPKTSAATHWFGYTKEEKPELWNEASALSHVSDKTPPTLFINSSLERMHAGRDDFQAVLRRHGIHTDTLTFENSPHTFCLFTPWFEPTKNAIISFLRPIFPSIN